MASYRTVLSEGQDEIIEKKSRFIGIALPVESEEHAEERIAACRKQYWDSSHVVYAYRIGQPAQTERSTDDGEPSHTAGVPILSYLQKEGLTKILVMVIRYFGGTLLGTGGLVRAYTLAARKGCEAAGILSVGAYLKMSLSLDYTRLGKIQYELAQKDYSVIGTEYTDKIRMEVLIRAEERDSFIRHITEVSDGTVIPEETEAVNAAYLDGKWHFFP